MPVRSPNPLNCCVGGVISPAAITINTSGTAIPVSTQSGDYEFGFDSANGRVVRVEFVTNSDGSTTPTYTYQDDGTPMSNNSTFTPATTTASIDTDDNQMFSTNTVSTDANYGLCLELEKRTEIDGDVITGVTYHLVNDVAAISGARGDDVTALVTAAPWSGTQTDEQSVIMPNINVTVTGATPIAMPAQATHAGYWRAEINNGSGVVYTTDGSVPTTTPLNGQLAPFGGVILLKEDEGAAFLALPVDGSGQVDAAASTDLSFEQRNKAA